MNTEGKTCVINELEWHISRNDLCWLSEPQLPYFSIIKARDFELWCWRRLLRIPWTANGSNQSILKEINSEYLLERTDTKAPIFWPPNGKNQLIGKDPDAGKDWRQKKRVTEDEMVRYITNLLCPMSKSPSGKREGLQDNAICKKGSLLLTRVRAPAASNTVVWGQRAPSPSCYTNL